MPSSKIECPYCTSHLDTNNLFKHILCKHEEQIFLGDSKAAQSNRNTLKQSPSKATPCPPTLYLTQSKDLLNPYYCCLGCSSAIKKVKCAIPHFPDCLAAHEQKRTELCLKYNGSEPVITQTTTIVSTITTTVTINDPMILAMLSKYHTRVVEEMSDNKNSDKKAYRMREWLRNKYPDVAEEFDEAEGEISDSSSIDEDPNDIVKKVVKECKSTIRFKTEKDENGNFNLSV